MHTYYSKESIEKAIGFLRGTAQRDPNAAKGVYYDDLIAAADFLSDHIDDEDVMSAQQVYLNLK